MNQLYEKKFDCHQCNDPCDQCSSLIKIDESEYEDSQLNSTSHIIFCIIRFIAYAVIIILFGYVLWRICIIDSNIIASDRFFNYSSKLENSNIFHRRLVRSIDINNHPGEQNSFGMAEKELSKDKILITKKEKLETSNEIKKADFDQLVNGLFNKIWEMHNDTERSHFDNNMKAVFQAWFPVFDALLPREFTEQDTARVRRSAEEDIGNFRADRKKREIDERKKIFTDQHGNAIEIIKKVNKDLSRTNEFRKDR